MIDKLYGVERDHQDADDATRLLAQQTHSVPALAALSCLRDYWPRRPCTGRVLRYSR